VQTDQKSEYIGYTYRQSIVRGTYLADYLRVVMTSDSSIPAPGGAPAVRLLRRAGHPGARHTPAGGEGGDILYTLFTA
jgi:hypothetical protein